MTCSFSYAPLQNTQSLPHLLFSPVLLIFSIHFLHFISSAAPGLWFHFLPFSSSRSPHVRHRNAEALNCPEPLWSLLFTHCNPPHLSPYFQVSPGTCLIANISKTYIDVRTRRSKLAFLPKRGSSRPHTNTHT